MWVNEMKTSIVGSVRILMQNTADWNLNQLSSKCKVADCDTHVGNQTCSYGETQLITAMNQFEKEFSVSFGLSRFWCKDQFQWYLKRIFIYRSKVCHWDFAWWNQTCSCWDKSVSITRYIRNDDTFQNIRTMWIVMQDTKPPIFQGVLLYK